jgi:hypothetical protein
MEHGFVIVMQPAIFKHKTRFCIYCRGAWQCGISITRNGYPRYPLAVGASAHCACCLTIDAAYLQPHLQHLRRWPSSRSPNRGPAKSGTYHQQQPPLLPHLCPLAPAPTTSPSGPAPSQSHQLPPLSAAICPLIGGAGGARLPLLSHLQHLRRRPGSRSPNRGPVKSGTYHQRQPPLLPHLCPLAPAPATSPLICNWQRPRRYWVPLQPHLQHLRRRPSSRSPNRGSVKSGTYHQRQSPLLPHLQDLRPVKATNFRRSQPPSAL